jgi:hypothetical protein
VDHRVLFLTLNATTYGDFLKTTLQGMGVPYEVLTPANWTGQDMNTFLYNAGGTGRYSAMVLYPSVDLLGNMNSTHVQQVEGEHQVLVQTQTRLAGLARHQGPATAARAAATAAAAAAGDKFPGMLACVT